jgi:hypothetical protein
MERPLILNKLNESALRWFNYTDFLSLTLLGECHVLKKYFLPLVHSQFITNMKYRAAGDT